MATALNEYLVTTTTIEKPPRPVRLEIEPECEEIEEGGEDMGCKGKRKKGKGKGKKGGY
jgi:hypothetical protein